MGGLQDNQVLIEKAITTSDFLSGGTLYPEQQTQFVNLVKRFSTMLGQVRFARMPQAQVDIDKLHIGEPITRAVDENTDTPATGKTKVNQVQLQALKVRSDWDITTETFQQNIEQDNFEQTTMEAMAQRISTDLELLAIQGDDTLTAGTPMNNLLLRNDGWLKLAKGAHVLDAGGATISSAIFRESKKMMPKQYRSDPMMRFIMSSTVHIDWQTLLGEQGTGYAGGLQVADDAISSKTGGTAATAPYGTPFLLADLFPDDLPITPSSGALPAQGDGSQYGPFVIQTGVNDTFTFTSTGSILVTVTLPGGILDTVAVVKAINDAVVVAAATCFARDTGDGNIRIQTASTGATESLVIGTSNANTTLGFVNGASYSGAAAGGGTINQGTSILMCNPKNLIHGMLDGTRIFTEFNKDYDRVESVVYNQCDAQIENLDALVLIENVLIRSL